MEPWYCQGKHPVHSNPALQADAREAAHLGQISQSRAAGRGRWASETGRQREGRMKQISSLMFGLLALLIVGSPAAQTTYPEKPIRIVIGFPPGGPTDIVARLVGQKFAEAWGKPVLVENVTGAAGNIAADRVAKAPPDGYTLGLLTDAQIVVNPGLYKLPHDPAKDFVPISQVCITPTILVVHNAAPAKSVRELVALAKARPG